MTRAVRFSFKLAVLLSTAMLISACGVDDRQSNYTQGNDIQHGHPAQWVAAGHAVQALPGNRDFCMQCHTDESVELSSNLSCRNCHIDGIPSAITSGDRCNVCHGFTSDSPPVRGSHQRHSGNSPAGYGYACASCHVMPAGYEHLDRRSSVTFSAANANAQYTGTEAAFDDYGVCRNTYCHSDGTFLKTGVVSENTSPQWGTSMPVDQTERCNLCHKTSASDPPAAGSHAKHAGAQPGGYGYSCSLCHRDPLVDASLHVNAVSEVEFSADPRIAGGTYTGSQQLYGSYGSCENTYCHSIGTSVLSGVIPVNASLQWGKELPDDINYTLKPDNWTVELFEQIVKCSSCHGGYRAWFGSYLPSPAYQPGSPKANSHNNDFHKYEWCNICHKTTYSNATAVEVNKNTHINGVYNVDPDTTIPGRSINFTYIKELGRGKCLNVSCHVETSFPVPKTKDRYW